MIILDNVETGTRITQEGRSSSWGAMHSTNTVHLVSFVARRLRWRSTYYYYHINNNYYAGKKAGKN